MEVTNLANNLGWLSIINRPQILLHGSVIVSTLVQEIAVLAVDSILLKRIDADLLRKIDSQDVEVALVKNLQPLLQTLLAIPEDLQMSVSMLLLPERIKQTFPSVVSKNRSPHSMKICFIGETSASLCAMNLRSVSSRVKVVAPRISSAGLTPYLRIKSPLLDAALGGQTSAT